ncbi:uncharacterized protein LOC142524425 isoform X2 [Primulina tabacum]|uniref:uncharacterized protein LOC142524425 isoform X2 n=1 Tax=Primulina tabacum TaxID=48773 RepID=UPI003F599CDB
MVRQLILLEEAFQAISMGGCDGEIAEEVACTLQGCYLPENKYSMEVLDFSRYSMIRGEKRQDLEYSFHEHSLKFTDIKTGHGEYNAIIVSASEDRTCKRQGSSVASEVELERLKSE